MILEPVNRVHGLSLNSLATVLGREASAVILLDRLRCCHPLDGEVHYERGCALREVGRDVDAIAALRRAVMLAPQIVAWRHILDSLTGQASHAAPVDYVRELFDQYADRFDQHLTERLRYRTPTAVADALGRVHPDAAGFVEVLDLGCGTGLMGAALRSRFAIAHLTGVDVSGAMLARLTLKGGYDAAVEADIQSFLAGTDTTHDLIVAADVLVYFGALDQFMAGASHALAPGGLLAVSVEESDRTPYGLRRNGRYAHHRDYLAAVAATAGLRIVLCETANLREEGGVPVAGLIVVLAAA